MFTPDENRGLRTLLYMKQQTQHDDMIDEQLRIMQYNVNKRREVMDSILNDISTKDFTILLIQEQYRQKHTNSLPIHQSWTLIEPTTRTNTPPRSAIYVNNKKLPFTSYEHIPISHTDVTAISVTPKPPLLQPTLIINVYNSHDQTLPASLHTLLTQDVCLQNYGAVIIAGDFNLHHSLWNPQGYLVQEPEAEMLIDTMMNANLRPLLQAGTVTFPTNNKQGGTAIDLVWSNEEAENLIIKCHTIEANNDHTSDHLPMEITLNVCPKTIPPPAPPYNFEETNWELLRTQL
jgi:endonuclease/exonuclease/phosphatase (EEP) superfamily protein YafD